MNAAVRRGYCPPKRSRPTHPGHPELHALPRRGGGEPVHLLFACIAVTVAIQIMGVVRSYVDGAVYLIAVYVAPVGTRRWFVGRSGRRSRDKSGSGVTRRTGDIERIS